MKQELLQKKNDSLYTKGTAKHSWKLAKKKQNQGDCNKDSTKLIF